MTEDSKAFGGDRWVYCRQHMNPHTTGWCSVRLEDKVLLDATNMEDAIKECQGEGVCII